MSTATLLLCHSWLRGRSRAGGAPRVRSAHLFPFSGWLRCAWGAGASPVRCARVLLALALTGGGAQAQTADAPPARIGGSAPQPCVTVEVAGHKAGHLDCASQRLAEAARTAQAQARAGIDTPVPSATSADIRTGVANQSAIRQRMGTSFGRSVHPQRPYRAPPVPRPGSRR